MSSYGRKFKSVPGKFSSAQWRSGNAARTAAIAKSSRTATAMARRSVLPGFTRSSGSYGRYGARARSLGLIPEKKFFDTALAFNFDSTLEVPATGQLALIPQGDTESTRDGRKATIKSVQIRGVVSVPPAAGAAIAGSCWMWLVLDTQANGAAAAATDVMTSAAAADCLLNLNNSGRFRILKKWAWNWAPTAGVSTAWANKTFNVEFFKSCNIDMDWSSTTGAITEIRSNNIFLLAGQSGIGDDIPTFAGNARVRFMG